MPGLLLSAAYGELGAQKQNKDLADISPVVPHCTEVVQGCQRRTWTRTWVLAASRILHRSPHAWSKKLLSSPGSLMLPGYNSRHCFGNKLAQQLVDFLGYISLKKCIFQESTHPCSHQRNFPVSLQRERYIQAKWWKCIFWTDSGGNPTEGPEHFFLLFL